MGDPIEKLRGCLLCEATSGINNFEYVIGDVVADEIESQYMKLAVDADGVPIRPGDTVECDTFGGGECAVLAVARDFWVDIEGFTHKPEVTRHVKPDTVESLLAVFQGETLSAQGEYAGEVIEADCFYRELRTLIEDYAERIRKVVEHD